MLSLGASLDSTITGLSAGIEQARRVAAQLSRENDSPRPTAMSTASEPEDTSEFEPDESMGTNIDVSV